MPDYEKTGVTVSEDERRAYVETMMAVANDFPDGAFWGFMQEKGISTEEIIEVSENRRDPHEEPDHERG